MGGRGADLDPSCKLRTGFALSRRRRGARCDCLTALRLFALVFNLRTLLFQASDGAEKTPHIHRERDRESERGWGGPLTLGQCNPHSATATLNRSCHYDMPEAQRGETLSRCTCARHAAPEGLSATGTEEASRSSCEEAFSAAMEKRGGGVMGGGVNAATSYGSFEC